MRPSSRGPGAMSITCSGGKKPTVRTKQPSWRGPGVLCTPSSGGKEHIIPMVWPVEPSSWKLGSTSAPASRNQGGTPAPGAQWSLHGPELLPVCVIRAVGSSNDGWTVGTERPRRASVGVGGRHRPIKRSGGTPAGGRRWWCALLGWKTVSELTAGPPRWAPPARPCRCCEASWWDWPGLECPLFFRRL